MNRSIAMTVDLEDWFHGAMLASGVRRIERDTAWLLEELDRYGIRATFFVLGDLLVESSALLSRISDAGHEIACHGREHRFLGATSPVEFRRWLGEDRKRLQDISQQPIVGFRAPFFSLRRSSAWALPLLVEAGFQYDASIYPAYNDRYGWPGAPRHPVRLKGSRLMLLPVPLLHLLIPIGFSGGAYLRILPWSLVDRVLRRRLARSEFCMVYVHPWETSVDIPRPADISLRIKLTRYPFLGRMREKLRLLFRSYGEVLKPMASMLHELEPLPEWEPPHG